MTTDITTIKAAVFTAMANGITMSPPDTRVTFRPMVRKSLVAAEHLGTIEHETVVVSALMGLGMGALEDKLWPAHDVTCLLSHPSFVNLIWLQVLAPGNYQIHVFGRPRTSDEWTMLPNFILKPDSMPCATMKFSPTQVPSVQQAFNATVCAMDALALLLSSPLYEAA